MAFCYPRYVHTIVFHDISPTATRYMRRIREASGTHNKHFCFRFLAHVQMPLVLYAKLFTREVIRETLVRAISDTMEYANDDRASPQQRSLCGAEKVRVSVVARL